VNFWRYSGEGFVKKLDFYSSNNIQLMHPFIANTRLTLGQLLARLRHIHQPDHKALAEALQISYTTYLKTERGNRELSFLMALRICQFYKLDLHEFVSMLSDEELGRDELPVIREKEKRKRKKGEPLKPKMNDIKTEPEI